MNSCEISTKINLSECNLKVTQNKIWTTTDMILPSNVYILSYLFRVEKYSNKNLKKLEWESDFNLTK